MKHAYHLRAIYLLLLLHALHATLILTYSQYSFYPFCSVMQNIIVFTCATVTITFTLQLCLGSTVRAS